MTQRFNLLASLSIGKISWCARLLERALNEHPDSSLPRGAVLIRHSVAAARSGDLDAARQSLAEARRSPDVEDQDLLTRVEELVAAAASSESSVGLLEPGEWPMPWGEPDRKGLMTSLPPEFTSSTLTDYWSRSLTSDVPQSQLAQQANPGGMPPGMAMIRSSISFGGRSRATRLAYGPGGAMVDPRNSTRKPSRKLETRQLDANHPTCLFKWRRFHSNPL